VTFKPQGIVLHHSLTKDSATVSWPAIRDYHVHTKGWLDIGYHFGVELGGSDYEALVGRPLDIEGAHCPQDSMNSKTIGICLVGNFDGQPPPMEQLVVLRDRLMVPLARIFGFPLDLEHVTFHRDHARDGRTCPGKAFTRELLAALLTKGGS